MKKESHILRSKLEANVVQSSQPAARVPRRRNSLMEQFNATFNRKLRSAFSAVDWGQVNHYMDKWN